MIKMNKIIKIISWVIVIIPLILSIIFGSVMTKRGKTIKAKDIRIEQLMNQRDSLTNTIQRLGAEDCITINCSVNVKAPNIMGQQNLHADLIAKTVASITRQELLDAKDSLANTGTEKNITKNGILQ